MAIPERAIVAVPLVLSVVALILSALALFAGRQEGFLEEYAIARVSGDGSCEIRRKHGLTTRRRST